MSGEQRHAAPCVFTIPHGQPFLETLARAILDGRLQNSSGATPSALDLTDTTLLMPTRRAQRALGEAFLKLSGQRAMLMPRIRPIGDHDEDSALLSALSDGGGINEDGSSLPPAIDDMERLLLLTKLVQSWSVRMRSAEADPSGEVGIGGVLSAGARTPAQAAHLAAELASLMDLVETEGASLAGLKDLVPEHYAEHWQKTLQFLDIVTTFWPLHLEERDLLSPKERRNRALRTEAERLTATSPDTPVIVAGVTGSIPATVELMRAVGGLENGAIVLPGLDLGLDRESWDAIAPDHPEHPQFGLKRLLDRLGVDREDVVVIEGPTSDPALAARERFVSETMRPTGTTGRWHDWTKSADHAELTGGLAGVSLIAADSASEEAETIALIMREAAEQGDRKVALVTPDRILARRVAARLETWRIRVDDSAGRPFAKTVPGAFLELVVDCVASGFAPSETMALLKHPLCRLGLEARDVRFAARALEVLALRTVYIGRGIEGLRTALAKARQNEQDGERLSAPARRMGEDHWQAAEDLVDRLDEAMSPLTAVFQEQDDLPLSQFAAAHAQAAERVARLPRDGDDDGHDAEAESEGEQDTSPIYEGEAGAAAAEVFSQLIGYDEVAPTLGPHDYPDLYRTLITGRNVLPSVPVHPNLSILGTFEARLLSADIVILGGLNDGIWPEPSDPGPWLNRPMRAEMGLPSPEEAIGQAAHDFTSLLGAPSVYLTRARKIDGVQTVPSRWLMRVEALLKGLKLQTALAPDQNWVGWARARDHVGERSAIRAPAPRPPVGARPRQMGVSRIETWIANPYAIYASRILKLEALPGLGTAPDAALRGGLIHEALSRFAAAYPEHLPDNTEGALMGFARDVLQDYTGDARVAAFWLPRFERFAAWFAETEPARREGLQSTMAEVDGKIVLDPGAAPFTLTARADRLDLTSAGVVITDYKTGEPPNDNKVKSGMSPQLPLEAAIALAGGFGRAVAGPVVGLRYIRASGAEPPGKEQNVKCDDIAALADETLRGVTALVARFDNDAEPFTAKRRPGFSYDYDDYAHLARVAEWESGLGSDDGGER